MTGYTPEKQIQMTFNVKIFFNTGFVFELSTAKLNCVEAVIYDK